MQYPKRRETNEQAEQRAERIKRVNDAQGCDVQGRPVTLEGELLKSLSQKEFEIYKHLHLH